MNTVKWLIVTAIFVFATLLLIWQEGHAYEDNTWLFEHKVIIGICTGLAAVYSLFRTIKSSS